jgi:hypothetical protein
MGVIRHIRKLFILEDNGIVIPTHFQKSRRTQAAIKYNYKVTP